jgi:hypothetical protein
MDLICMPLVPSDETGACCTVDQETWVQLDGEAGYRVKRWTDSRATVWKAVQSEQIPDLSGV